MAPNFQIEPERYAFESQIRELYGRCAYSHKAHMKMADRLGARLWLGKWANIIISALITGGAVGVLFGKENPFFAYGTAAISFFSLILNAYLKDLDPGALAQKHRESGSGIWDIREGYLSLLTDTLDPKVGIGELRSRRDELTNRLQKVYQAAPQTTGKAYSQAQDALKNKEDLTFSENELDLLLPPTLRRSARKESDVRSNAADIASTGEGEHEKPTREKLENDA